MRIRSVGALLGICIFVYVQSADSLKEIVMCRCWRPSCSTVAYEEAHGQDQEGSQEEASGIVRRGHQTCIPQKTA